MPNWCNNNIEIHGPIEKIKAMYNEAVQDADDETGLLNHLCPMPKELHNTTKGSNGDDFNWYDWRVSNWSTKWEVSSEGLEFEDNGDGTATISGWFDSAWSPPIGAYERFCDENEDCSLTASYYEPGCDFAGFWIDGDDEYLENLQDEYKKGDDACDLFKRLDDEYNLSEQFAEWEEDYVEEDE